jgi:hypothetical protein
VGADPRPWYGIHPRRGPGQLTEAPVPAPSRTRRACTRRSGAANSAAPGGIEARVVALEAEVARLARLYEGLIKTS